MQEMSFKITKLKVNTHHTQFICICICICIWLYLYQENISARADNLFCFVDLQGNLYRLFFVLRLACNMCTLPLCRSTLHYGLGSVENWKRGNSAKCFPQAPFLWISIISEKIFGDCPLSSFTFVNETEVRFIKLKSSLWIGRCKKVLRPDACIQRF